MNKLLIIKFHVLGLLVFIGLASFGQSSMYQDLQLLLLNDDYDKIIDTTSFGIVRDSSALDLYFFQAVAYREKYQFEKSIKSCKQLLSRDENNKEVLKLLAKNYISLKSEKGALKIYEGLYIQDTNNNSIKVQLAKLYQSAKEYEKAKELYEDLFSMDTTNSYFCKQLGLCLLELRDASALRVLGEAVMLNPMDVRLAIKLANKSNDLRNYFYSLSILDYVIPYNPEVYQLYKVKGYTHFLLKNNDKAAKDFEKVLELGDTTRFTLKYLGYSYFEMQDYEKSYKALHEVFNYDTTDTRVYFHLSIAARKLYKSEESLKHMEKSIKLLLPTKNTMALYYMQAAENYITHGDRCKINSKSKEEKQAYHDAIEYFKLAYDEDSTESYALYQIGVTYDKYLNEKTSALVYYTDYRNTLRQYTQETDDQYITRISFIKNKIQKLREDLHFEDQLD
jgi:tetratricopeptide (TPR) repeat protein